MATIGIRAVMIVALGAIVAGIVSEVVSVGVTSLVAGGVAIVIAGVVTRIGLCDGRTRDKRNQCGRAEEVCFIQHRFLRIMLLDFACRSTSDLVEPTRLRAHRSVSCN